MSHADEFEDETDRHHCRLDMDRADEAPAGVARTSARSDWWQKWGQKVRRFLDEGVMEDQAEIDGLKLEIEESNSECTTLEGDLVEAREEITILTKAITEARKILENAL